jgi:hypothetical protein
MEGLRIYNSAGSVIYDSTTVTWNLLDSVYVAAYASYQTHPHPEVNNFTSPTYATMRFLVNTVPTDQSAIMADVAEVNSYTFSTTGGTADTIVIILVR